MSSSDNLKIDFGDGVSALDRAMRSIVMIADSAISELLEMGYDRDKDDITIDSDPDDPLPMFIRFRNKKVFRMNIVKEDDGRICFIGEWLSRPKKKGFFAKVFGF